MADNPAVSIVALDMEALMKSACSLQARKGQLMTDLTFSVIDVAAESYAVSPILRVLLARASEVVG